MGKPNTSNYNNQRDSKLVRISLYHHKIIKETSEHERQNMRLLLEKAINLYLSKKKGCAFKRTKKL